MANNQTLEQQAQQLYETGKFVEAISLLEQAINNYTAKGDLIGQAIALRNLSLVYQQQGKWERADGAISESINLLDTLGRSP